MVYAINGNSGRSHGYDDFSSHHEPQIPALEGKIHGNGVIWTSTQPAYTT